MLGDDSKDVSKRHDADGFVRGIHYEYSVQACACNHIRHLPQRGLPVIGTGSDTSGTLIILNRAYL